jgi:hypothetical protein
MLTATARYAAIAIGLALVVAGCGAEVQVDQGAAGASAMPAATATPGADGRPGTARGPRAVGGTGGNGGDGIAEPASEQRPSDLVGLWRIDGDGIEKGTTVRLEDQGLSVYGKRCISRDGSWKARRTGEFVADLYSWHSSCRTPDLGPVEWFERVVAFRTTGKTRQLLDDHRRVVATLTPRARIKPVKDRVAELSRAPRLTGEQRVALDRPAPALPQGLSPVSAQALAGRWIPQGAAELPTAGNLWLDFEPGGKWSSDDGCNVTGGRWALGSAAQLIAVAGPSTLVGCRGIHSASWMVFGALAGLDGDTLVLIGWDGDELGRLDQQSQR